MLLVRPYQYPSISLRISDVVAALSRPDQELWREYIRRDTYREMADRRKCNPGTVWRKLHGWSRPSGVPSRGLVGRVQDAVNARGEPYVSLLPTETHLIVLVDD